MKEIVDEIGLINRQIQKLKKEADEGERKQRNKLKMKISSLKNDKAQLK